MDFRDGADRVLPPVGVDVHRRDFVDDARFLAAPLRVPSFLSPSLQSLEEMERDHIAKVLQTVGGHRDKAALILGITRSTLWRKIKKFGLAE